MAHTAHRIEPGYQYRGYVIARGHNAETWWIEKGVWPHVDGAGPNALHAYSLRGAKLLIDRLLYPN